MNRFRYAIPSIRSVGVISRQCVAVDFRRDVHISVAWPRGHHRQGKALRQQIASPDFQVACDILGEMPAW